MEQVQASTPGALKGYLNHPRVFSILEFTEFLLKTAV